MCLSCAFVLDAASDSSRHLGQIFLLDQIRKKQTKIISVKRFSSSIYRWSCGLILFQEWNQLVSAHSGQSPRGAGAQWRARDYIIRWDHPSSSCPGNEWLVWGCVWPHRCKSSFLKQNLNLVLFKSSLHFQRGFRAQKSVCCSLWQVAGSQTVMINRTERKIKQLFWENSVCIRVKLFHKLEIHVTFISNRSDVGLRWEFMTRSIRRHNLQKTADEKETGNKKKRKDWWELWV